MTTLAFIDDMTFSLVWAAQVLWSELCDRALQEVSSHIGLRKGRSPLFKGE